MAESLSEESASMKLQNHPAVQRRDLFLVDPRVLKVDPNYNVREMESPETVAHIDALKATIADSGVRTPLQVRLVGDDIFIVSGHCRHAAVMALIAEGRDDIRAVPAVPEPQGTSEVERTLNLHLANANNPLSTLAKAKIVKRLLDFGWTEDNIARRMGWKSRASVTQALEIVALSEPMQKRIRKGEVSATTARNLAKSSELTPEQQEALIAANLEENKRIKGKKKQSTKVTNKTLKRDAKAKAKPPAQLQAQEPSHAEPQSLPATAEESSVQPPSPSAVATPAQPLSGISENRTEPAAGDQERDQGVVQLAPTQSRNGLKELIDALLPFARMAEITNLDELADDYLHEVSNRDIKRAALAWFKSTGETTTGNGEQSEAA